ncbi:basic salivary proline-rich protein 3-like [Bacillus rossius redtenbacheri]|uniref:basic salivary proline-rich protein 3-like n=1 Tax=Bacillus rossius redtenbacheri TaxID=93214 RepID=UPI002FDECA77
MKNRTALTWLVVAATTAAAVAAEDWVWSSNGRDLGGATGRLDDRGSYRLEDTRRPSRLTDYDRRPPAPIYESNSGDSSAPPPRRPGYRPPGGGAVLTGPTPSWEHHEGGGRYRDYDHCKCAYAFNCASPGILFGSCDVDKQYCCNDEKHLRPGQGSRFDGREEGRPPRFDGREDGRPPRFDGREDGRPPRFDGREDGRPPRFDGREDGRPPRFDGRDEGRPPRFDRPVLVGPGGPAGVPGNYGGGYGGYRPQRGDGFYDSYSRSSSVDAKATKN